MRQDNAIIRFFSNKVNHTILSMLLMFLLGMIFKNTLTIGQSLTVIVIILLLLFLWYVKGIAQGIVFLTLQNKKWTKIMTGDLEYDDETQKLRDNAVTELHEYLKKTNKHIKN